MRGYRKVVIIVVMIGAVLGVGVWLFYYTGGMGLVRLYQNYLTQELPDKKLSWQDFTDRGPREMLHGYYAGGDSNGLWIWTLSGIMRYNHQQGTSVYHYIDTCSLVKSLEEKQDKGSAQRVELQEETYFKIDTWRQRARRGDYMWVKRVGEGAESRMIDKVWANSNQHYPVEQMTREQCEK